MSAKAGTITSASVSLGCPNQPNPSGSMSGTNSATFDASCELNGPHASGEASAQASVGQLSSSASVGGTELFGGTTATADAQYTDTITVSGPTVVFQFNIDGTIIHDWAGAFGLFTISVPGASDSTPLTVCCHIGPIDQIFTSAPLPVIAGVPFTYTADLQTTAILGGSQGSADLQAVLLGISSGGGGGLGQDAPEPGTLLLAGLGVAAVVSRTWMRGRKSAAATS
jgi:hypothetical protein